MTSNHLKKEREINAVVDAMIPATEGEERFWDTAAREVLRGVLAHCNEHNRCSHAELWQALNSPVAEIRDMCRATALGRVGYTFIKDADSQQAAAVHAHLISYMSCLKVAARSKIERE